MSKTEIDQQLTKKVADLARIELTDQEIEIHTRHLQQILTHIERLHEVDVTGIAPMIHPHEATIRYRPDELRIDPINDSGERVLRHAPNVQDDAYRVPKIV